MRFWQTKDAQNIVDIIPHLHSLSAHLTGNEDFLFLDPGHGLLDVVEILDDILGFGQFFAPIRDVLQQLRPLRLQAVAFLRHFRRVSVFLRHDR